MREKKKLLAVLSAVFVCLLGVWGLLLFTEDGSTGRIHGQTEPVSMCVGVMSLVFNWNDFYQPLIYLNSTKKFTVIHGGIGGAGDAASGSRICGRRRDVAAQEAFVMREKKKLRRGKHGRRAKGRHIGAAFFRAHIF